jgi:bacillolysin
MPKPSELQKQAFNRLKKVDTNISVTWNENTGTPTRLRGILSRPIVGNPEIIANQFITEYVDLFAMKRPEKELKLLNVQIDKQGNRHIRYQQLYKGLPVYNSQLIVHLDSNNSILGTSGVFVPHISVSSRPKISLKDAKEKVRTHSNENREIPEKTPSLLIFVNDTTTLLAWNITVLGMDRDLFGNNVPALWEYFVNALNGEIVRRYNSVNTYTRTHGRGIGKYSGSVALQTIQNDTQNIYELQDRWISTGTIISTYDGNGYVPVFFPPMNLILSSDDDNNWSEIDQQDEVDCHYFTRIIYNYFLRVHGRDSYDGARGEMKIYANCGFNNACWHPWYQSVFVGKGDGVSFDDFCALDVISHEWMHAITISDTGLGNQGIPGAINESISDVFAAIINGNWMMGEDLSLGTNCSSLRNLADPTNGGQYDPSDPVGSAKAGNGPDHMDDLYTGNEDNGGVHMNCSIINKAAYLIAAGGTHHEITMCDALGCELLGQLYYRALNYLTPTSDFLALRDALLDSLEDLYGPKRFGRYILANSGDPRYQRWAATITNAFASVGIGTAVLCPIIDWAYLELLRRATPLVPNRSLHH